MKTSDANNLASPSPATDYQCAYHWRSLTAHSENFFPLFRVTTAAPTNRAVKRLVFQESFPLLRITTAVSTNRAAKLIVFQEISPPLLRHCRRAYQSRSETDRFPPLLRYYRHAYESRSETARFPRIFPPTDSVRSFPIAVDV